MKTKRILLIILSLLLLFSCGSSVYFYHEYKTEKDKLKKALIPSFNQDYFTKITIIADERAKVSEINPNDDFYLEKSFISDVPRIGQMPDFPNGCEAVSATMLLNYFGIKISVSDFIDNYLPTGKVYEKEGIRYGPNPVYSYAGDPRDTKRGWGAFAPAVKNAVENASSGTKLKVTDATGTSLSYIAKNLPAVIWVGQNFEEADDVYMWFNESETEVYTYPKKSHTVLLIGYDKDYCYINDPLNPETVVTVKKDILEKSYNSYGRQAIIAEKIG